MRAARIATAVICLAAPCLAASARAQGVGAPSGKAPASPAVALDQAAAAYEYGDMNQVVDAARPVAEGALAATDDERARALRLLGVGLYLTGRKDGANAAFFELLRLRPDTRLDPTTTRPEVVAFLEEVRRTHRAELIRVRRASRHQNFAWNFLPPAGQFQNGDSGRGWTIAALEAVSLGAAVATRLVLQSWRAEGKTFPGHEDAAQTLRTVNWISAGVLAATFVAGVVDGMIRYGSATDESRGQQEPRVVFAPLPLGAAAALSF